MHGPQKFALIVCQLALLILQPSVLWAAGLQCEQKQVLVKHSGHYAKKSLWENLPSEKVWSKANQKFNGWVSAIDIDGKGELSASYGWHEGGNPCVMFRSNELWVVDRNSPSTKWEGPYVRVGLPFSGEVAYFNRIFGNKCYSSTNGDKWCFVDGAIKIGLKTVKARLELDTSEMPEYGTPVTVDAEQVFWVFVPNRNGWKIFRDTFVTEDGHKDIDPIKSKPWQLLTYK